VRAVAAASWSPCSGQGQRGQTGKEAEGDGRGRLAEPTGQADSPSSDNIPAKFFPTLPLQDSALKVFDKMPARSQNSNFRNFQIGLVIILDRDSKTIVLGQGVVFCFRAILNLGLSYVSDSNFG
jgi:hypothetical protein